MPAVAIPDPSRQLIDLHARAAAYLKDLQEERVPEEEPAEDLKWAEAFLQAFREMRDRQRGTEIQRAAERFGQFTAADPYRFFWEFWQNAEDASAQELIFEIADNHLRISNDGKPFTSREVFSLLTVAASSKDADDLGQFGIGSLSLMGVCDAPVYRSGHFWFQVERSYTYPAEVPHATDDGWFQGTGVDCILREGVDAEALYSELVRRASEETLLYMRHLQRVVIRCADTGDEQVFTAKMRKRGGGEVVTVAGRSWLRFLGTVEPPPNLQRADGTPVTRSVEITLARYEGMSGKQPIISFFPTTQRHDYPWRFSARFDVTNSRESILDRDFNRWLLREVGKLMVRAAASAGVGNPNAPWDLVPLKADPDSLLGEVAAGAFEEMSTTAWLPGSRGPVDPGHSVFSVSTKVRELFGSADLAQIGLHDRVWVRGIPSAEAGEALVRLGAERACCHKLSALLALGLRQSAEWYLEALSTAVDLARRYGDATVTQQLIEGRCVLDRQKRPVSLSWAQSQERVVCNATSETVASELAKLFGSRVLVMLHKVYRISHDRKTEDPLYLPRRTVDEWLRENSRADTFAFESHLDAAAFIKHFIVEAGRPSHAEIVSDELLNFVRDHLETYVNDQPKQRRDQVLKDLGNILLIRARAADNTGQMRTQYRPISEVYLPAGILDGAHWATAARRVPDLWWADWHYRQSLVRPKNPLGVPSFLRQLGAKVGPSVQPIPMPASHGYYRFTRVTHGDSRRSPNFPHDQVASYSYSDYGLESDYESTDLDRWWDYVQGLPSTTERSKRGEALLRMFESQWSDYEDFTIAKATGYSHNAGVTVASVPTRWRWYLMHREWVLRNDGTFTAPSDPWARTDTSVRLLGNANSLTRWEIREPGVASQLGFNIDIPSTFIIRLLRRTRDATGTISLERARAWYEYLSRWSELPSVHDALREGLIYSPGVTRRWWSPEECVTGGAASFEGLCGDLSVYSGAKRLWSALSIPEAPTSSFLAAVWRYLPNHHQPDDPTAMKMLAASYQLAENRLLTGKEPVVSVPVIADGAWHRSGETFSTGSDDLLANVLRGHGLFRWDLEAASMRPKVQRWLGILLADSEGSRTAQYESCEVDSEWEAHLHEAVLLFAKETAGVGGDSWAVMGPRVREIVRGRVQVAESLRVQTKLAHPTAGQIEATLPTTAFQKAGNVLLSAAAGRSDATEIAQALIVDLPLTVEQRWGAVNSLRYHLGQEELGEIDPLLLDTVDPSAPTPDSAFWESESADGKDSNAPVVTPVVIPTKNPSKKNQGPELPPTDSYEVASDSGSETGESIGGGLQTRPTADLKKPRKGQGYRYSLGGGQPRSPQTTEQRGVDLFTQYVLAPHGIEVTDQRVHAGVGADLVGTDQVFRELKTFTGPAGPELPLTEHEYKRAGGEGKNYELVIVEHIGDGQQPKITVIRDPLKRLGYYPTGGVRVRGWQQLQPPPRVVVLTQPKD